MKKMVENIGKRVVERLFDFGNNGYEMDGGILGISFTLDVCGRALDCRASIDNGRLQYLEAMFSGGGYENVENGIEAYVRANTDVKGLWTTALGYISDYDGDEPIDAAYFACRLI